jgi:hypothetical protein
VAGATTLSIMTFSIPIKNCDTQHNNIQHNGTCAVMLSVSNMHFLSSVIMLNVVMLSVTMVNVIMLIVVMLSVMAPSGILANPGQILYKNICVKKYCGFSKQN